jgi:hypothetical protein
VKPQNQETDARRGQGLINGEEPMPRKRYTAKGQAMFIVILALPVIVGVLTIVMDVGNLYYNQISMQVAMDSGALAGAYYLPSYPSQAKSVAQDYAVRNGLKASEIVSVTVTPDNKIIIMTSARDLHCFFCAVLGEGIAHAQSAPSSESTAPTVKATGTALIVPIRAATGVLPLGVDYRTDMTFGNVIQLKEGQVGAGNWGALALGGSGASNYRSNLQNGYQSLVSMGDMIDTETGNVVGPTRQGIQDRISTGQNQFSTGTYQNHDLNDPRVILIPIVDFSNIHGKSQIPVKGFAMVWVSSMDSKGSLTCYFVQQCVHASIADASGATPNTGATKPVLK